MYIAKTLVQFLINRLHRFSAIEFITIINLHILVIMTLNEQAIGVMSLAMSIVPTNLSYAHAASKTLADDVLEKHLMRNYNQQIGA